jgi:hypothetical protein
VLRSLLLAVLMAACSVTGSQRTFELDGVTVVDDAGLVTGATAGATRPQSTERPLVVRGDSLTQIAVHWRGSSCVRGWTVRVGGNRLLIVIEPGETQDPCSGTLAEPAVTLDLNRVVDADAIDIEQRDGP